MENHDFSMETNHHFSMENHHFLCKIEPAIQWLRGSPLYHTQGHPSEIHHFKYKIHHFNAKSLIFNTKPIILLQNPYFSETFFGPSLPHAVI